MGDRCWLNIKVRTSQVDEIHRAIGYPGDEVEETDEGYTAITYYEANYALCDELVAAATSGIDFLAHNGPGDNYGAGSVLGYDGGCYEIATDNEGGPIVSVGNDGEPNHRQLTMVRQFILLEQRLWDDFNGKDRGVVPLSEWKCNKTRDG